MNYCKLYIDVEMGIEELQSLIDENVENFFESGSVDVIVFQNENYQVGSNLQSTTYPVDRSRYYVEIEPASDRDLERFTFESAIAQLVDWLRKECEYVVASCEFEDFIVEQTGWNWTLENPLPPR
jgi:hypothetical protein